VCSRKSEISAFVEKKTGFDGNRTLIQGGFCAWCNAGSIFAQDTNKDYNVKRVEKSEIAATPAFAWLQRGRRPPLQRLQLRPSS
jgi:hypothetical protein